MTEYNNEEAPKTRVEKVISFFDEVAQLINAFFLGVNTLIMNSEYSFVNLVAAFIPWLVPLIPAALTYEDTQLYLGFDPWLAMVSAIIVEGLGLVSASTYYVHKKHNDSKDNRKKENKVSVIVPAFSFGFYLVVVLVVNVILESFPNEVWAQIAARSLLILLSPPAVLILAVRNRRASVELSNGAVSSQLAGSYDSSGSSDSYVRYDYRRDLGNVLSVEQKSQVLDLLYVNQREWIFDQYPGINPEYVPRWLRNMKRDVEAANE